MVTSVEEKLERVFVQQQELRSLRRLRRDVDQLQRRVGPPISEPLERVIREIGPDFPGSGPFVYDYLVDEDYDGPNGQELPTINGNLYKLYNDPLAASDDADVNRQASGQDSTFLIAGDFSISSTLTPRPPSGGTYHFLGIGPQATSFNASANGQTLFAPVGSGRSPQIHMQDFKLDAGSFTTVKLFGAGLNTMVRCRNVEFDCFGAGSVGVDLANDNRRQVFENCYFLGSGATGISGANNAWLRVDNCHFDDLAIGVRLLNTPLVQVFGSTFFQTDEGITIDGNSIGQPILIGDNIFELSGSGVGIAWQSGTNTAAALLDGNSYFLGSANIGIDFQLLNVSGAVFGVVISSQRFFGTSGAIGIRGDAKVTNSLISHCGFYNLDVDDEIVDWDLGAGNESYHNISTDDVGVKQALADIGTPVGHGGSSFSSIVSKAGAYTATDSDIIIVCDASSGAFTITLPTAVGRRGKAFYIKKTDATANAVTIDADGAETIDGALTQVIAMQYNSLSLVSDGSNWHIL